MQAVQNLPNDDLILECFERIGIAGEQLVPVQMNSARRSLNLLLLDWLSKSLNLWTLKIGYLSLESGQCKYLMESSTIDIFQINLRQFTRVLNGIPKSNTLETSDGLGGGTVANAFIESNSSCTQLAENGNISYSFEGNKFNTINFIGVKSNVDREYSFNVEYSNDGVTWELLMEIPLQSFTKGTTIWFDVERAILAKEIRLRLTNDVILDVQEIYFTNNIVDLNLSKVSRNSYLSFSQKFTQGRPTCYYFDKQIEPILNIWQSPAATYKVLQYSFIRVMKDIKGFYDVADVPSRLFPALTWGLTWMLAVKYNPEIAPFMKDEYDQSFNRATENDVENVDLTINYDVSSYDY